MATAKLKRKPGSQKSSPIKLLILKKCSLASSFATIDRRSFSPLSPGRPWPSALAPSWGLGLLRRRRVPTFCHSSALRAVGPFGAKREKRSR
jgi:hypothetical protein